MKREFYKTMYRLLAGTTRRVNWRWLNEWKVAMGISLIAAGHTAAGKEVATARVAARFEVQDETNLDVLAPADSIAKKEDVFCYVAEEMPVFTAGSLQAYVRQHLLYPVEALQKNEKGPTGKVYVQFIIEADGSMANPRVVRGVHPILDSAAVEFVSRLPEFLPGKLRGKPARCSYTLPLNFTPEMLNEARLKKKSLTP